MSSAARIFAVGALALAFAGLDICAPAHADDALTLKLRNQMAATQGESSPSGEFRGGGFEWGARPTFRPVGVASENSSVTAPSQPGQSFDLLAEPVQPADNGASGAGFTLTSSEPLYTDDTAEAQPVAPEAELAGGSEREGGTGPLNFPISKSVKIKAQPLGGGTGGRVTFTFMLPTGQ